ncbi:hypothetical protein AN1V17_02640 [Vallitalea sediminicola]
MCLAIPAQIKSIEGAYGEAMYLGVVQRVNIELIESPSAGDYILIHAGFAIEKIDEDGYVELERIMRCLLEECDSYE